MRLGVQELCWVHAWALLRSVQGRHMAVALLLLPRLKGRPVAVAIPPLWNCAWPYCLQVYSRRQPPLLQPPNSPAKVQQAAQLACYKKASKVALVAPSYTVPHNTAAGTADAAQVRVKQLHGAGPMLRALRHIKRRVPPAFLACFSQPAGVT